MVPEESSSNFGSDINFKQVLSKGLSEAVKYTTKLSNLEEIIYLGKFNEYSEAIHKTNITGASGEFRGLIREVKEAIKEFKRKDLKEAQEVKGEGNWSSHCPNCGSEDLETCAVCYVRLLTEIQKVKAKKT